LKKTRTQIDYTNIKYKLRNYHIDR